MMVPGVQTCALPIWARGVAFDRAVPFRRRHGLVTDLDAFVVCRHLLRPGVVGPEALEDCRDSQTTDSELCGTVQEGAPVDIAVLIFVKEVQQILRVIRSEERRV